MPGAISSKGRDIALVGIAAVLVLLGGSLTYLQRLKPPGCNDPGTLILVGYGLARLLGPAPIPELVRVRTVLGGTFAIRFVCSAEFANPDQITLSGGIRAGSIRYTSQLRGPRRVHDVKVSLVPIVPWQRAQ